MGKYGALLVVPATFPREWWDELTLPNTSLEISGTTVIVRKGISIVEVVAAKGPPILNGVPVLVVQYGGIRRRTRDENKRLAEEIMKKLIALGAIRLSRELCQEPSGGKGVRNE